VTTRERYDAMIKSPIGVHLRELGFRKQRNAFFRSTEHGWIAIDFQASQFGTRESVSFTVNLGANFVELRTSGEEPPLLGRAHVEFQRLGHLLPQARDYWWRLEPDTDLDSIANELIWALDQYAIPWLERRQVFSEVLDAVRIDERFLRSIQISRLSVLAGKAGNAALSSELRQLSDRRHRAELATQND
jgi:hypothetical protein